MVGGPPWREPASDEDDDDSNVEDRRLKAKKQKKPKPDPKPAPEPEPEPAPKRAAWSRLEPRRSARVNAAGQSTDTPERRKPPRFRIVHAVRGCIVHTMRGGVHSARDGGGAKCTQ